MDDVSLALLGFSATAGVLAFFSPCSVALLPAYVGYFVGTEGRAGSPVRRAAAGLGFGAIASVAFLALFAVVGLLVAAGSRFLEPWIPHLALLVGVLLVGLGTLQLAGRSASLGMRVPFLRQRTPFGFAAFGLAYGVGSLGCTFPLFLNVVFAGLAAGGLGAILVLGAYGMGMAALMVGLSGLLAVSRDSAALGIRRIVPVVARIAPLIVIGAGVYIVFYYARFLGWVNA